MFDNAKDFHIENARFNDNRGRAVIGSGNSYNNKYNNSFNDNSRREYITHHDTTHHHGPVHNIEKAGNVNLGTNYGHLEMNQHEEPREFSRDSSPEREDQAHYREDVPRQAQGYPSHGYPSQDSRSFSQGYYDPNPPPRTAPVGPHPGHRDGIRRAQTNPPPAHWGSKNPFIPYLDSVDDDQPTRPPFRSAPATHQPPVYDRMPTGYESYRNEQDERSRAHARDTQREYSARVDDHDRTSRRETSHFPQPHNRAPSPPRRATMHHDYDHRGQDHSQSRSKKMHRRPPSPAYPDSSDSEKHTYNGDGRRGTRKQAAETRQFDRAMDHVNRMADRMSRMKF